MKGVFLDTGTLGEDVSLEIIENLDANLQWIFYAETSNEETLDRIKEADIVISNKVQITKNILDQCSHIKLICVAATGYNNIDIQAAHHLKIAVCNIPGYSTLSVAQLVMTFIFALSFNLVGYVNDVKRGVWQRQSQFCFLTHPIFELKGKVLGIIGYGNLGKQVANLAENFGMQVVIGSHSDPKKSQEGRMPFIEVIQKSDFITLHVPLTAETKNLITRQVMEKMKPSAFLINTARGGIVNEKDLAEILKEKRIAGAAFDVLTNEPPTTNNPLLDPNLSNLLLTPHIGWASYESKVRLILAIKKNIEAFLKGKPQNLIPQI